MAKTEKSLQAMDLKISNRVAILNIIRRKVCSRAEISNVLGMSRPAVSSIISELIEEELIYEAGRGESTLTGGKRPILLAINNERFLNVAIYFNGEWFEIAIMDLDSNVLHYVKRKATINSDYRITFDEIIEEVKIMMDKSRPLRKEGKILACGIVLKGLVNTETGIMSYSATLPHWKNVPVEDYFKNKLDLPVFIENDARAYTIYERQNLAANQNSLVCVNIGIGVGTGVVINNKIYRGASGIAVNFAHTTVLDGGPLCTCGNRGCWEALTSISALLKKVGDESSQYKNMTIDQVIREYHFGNSIVKQVINNYTGYWLGVGISNILRVFNPECIVIQGDLVRFGEELLEKVKEVVIKRASAFNNTKILFSQPNSQLNVESASEFILSYFYSKKYHYSIWHRERVNEYEISSKG